MGTRTAPTNPRNRNQGRVAARLLRVVAALAIALPWTALGTQPVQASGYETPVLLGANWLGGSGVDVCVPAGSRVYQDCGTVVNGATHVGEAYDSNGNALGYWQCVELAQRLYKKMGWAPGVFPNVGGAKQIYTNAAAGTWSGFQAHANGSAWAPVPGDMIVEDAAQGNWWAGHVSVVDWVSGGTIHAVEQNASATGMHTYHLEGWTIKGGWAPVLGTVHATANNTAYRTALLGGTVTLNGLPVAGATVHVAVSAASIPPSITDAAGRYGSIVKIFGSGSATVETTSGSGTATFGISAYTSVVANITLAPVCVAAPVKAAITADCGGGGGGTSPPASDGLSLVSVSKDIVQPNQHFQPTVTVHVDAGELRQDRGDMLRCFDAGCDTNAALRYQAYAFVSVAGTTGAGSNYTFTFYANNPMVAPSSTGSYSSTWRVWRAGAWSGPVITITFVVEGDGIRVCDGQNLGPECRVFSVGQYGDLSAYGWGDRIESLEFKGSYQYGYHVVLWSEKNFTGNPVHFETGAGTIDASVSNHTRSMQVYQTSGGIKVCDGSGYGEPCKLFGAGEYGNLADQGWADRIESIQYIGKYIGNYHVVLNSEVNFTGNPVHFDAGASTVDLSVRNHTRSMKIYCSTCQLPEFSLAPDAVITEEDPAVIAWSGIASAYSVDVWSTVSNRVSYGRQTAQFISLGLLPAGTTTWYSLDAFFDDAAGETGWSPARSLRVSPATPGWPYAEPVGCQAAELHWTDRSTVEDGYRIYRTEGNTTTLIDTVGAETSSYLDAPLVAATTYTYDVRSVKNGIESPATAGVDVTPCPAPLAGLNPTTAFGSGADGDAVVAAGQTLYLNAVRSALSGTAAAGATQLTVTSATGFATGDEVLLQQARGTGAGVHEYATVAGVSGPTLLLDEGIAGSYVTDATSRAQVIRVPHYGRLEVQDGGLAAIAPWDGTTGGVGAVRVSGELLVAGGGAIRADGAGFRGGVMPDSGWTSDGYNGESYTGPSTHSHFANGGGGAGGCDYQNEGGSGGSYGGVGTVGGGNLCAGQPQPGSLYGDRALVTLLPGSGGGSAGGCCADGGAGGGALVLAAARIQVDGSVTADGAVGQAGGNNPAAGGGSGGAVHLVARDIEVNGTLEAAGGAGGWSNVLYIGSRALGGNGGAGRVRFDYCDSASGTATPTASVGQLLCLEKPGAPFDATATPHSGGAHVTWTAPLFDGGSPVTGYAVTASPGGGTCTPVPATATSCTVSGLSDGTTYQFTVTATNAVGAGEASAASAGVLVAPSADATLASLAVSAGSLAPGFSPAVHTYTVLVPNATETLTIAASPANDAAATELGVGGGPWVPLDAATTSDPIALPVGATTVAVRVTADDGTTTLVYTVTVTRAALATVSVPASGGPATIAVSEDPALGSPTVGIGSAAEGASVTVEQVADPSTDLSPFSTGAGTVIVDISAPGTTGPYTVCLAGEAPARLWHWEADTWVDRTSPAPDDYLDGHVCGTTDTLSPFAVAPVKDGTPPQFTKPIVMAIRTGVGLPSASASSAIPVTLSWAATDAGSGLVSYTLERTTNGGVSWTPVPLSTALAGAVPTSVPASGTVRFRVTASDAQGNTATSTTPALRPSLVQQSSAAIRWAGTWRPWASGGLSGGSDAFATAKGSTAVYRFTGRLVGLVSVQGPGRGYAWIYVDGVLRARVNLASATVRARAVVWRYRWDVAGTHTVKVWVAGTAGMSRVDVDAFVVVR